MLIQKYSKVQKIFGTVSATSLIVGILGTAGLMVIGVGTSQLYWNMVYAFVGMISIGLISMKMYTLIWRNKR